MFLYADYDGIHANLLRRSANAWHADRTGERYLHIVLPLCVSILAFILAMATSGVGPRYFAMMVRLSSKFMSQSNDSY